MNDPTVKYITSLYPYRSNLITPVGQLVEVGARSEIVGRFCTGFNISPGGHFLSAGHCLSKNGGQFCHIYDNHFDLRKIRVSFNYQCQSHSDLRVCNVSAYEPTVTINRVAGQGSCINNRGQIVLDYAVMVLEPAASSYSYLPISAADPKLFDDVILVHHPRGELKQYSVGKINAIDMNHSLIDYTAHTYGGSSGAPVISLEQNRAVAVHVSGTELPNRMPDHKHHIGVPTKAILTAALNKGEHWATQLGFFKSQPKISVNINTAENRLAYSYNSAPGCCG